MKEFVKVWVSRLVILAALFYVGKTWGVPLYKQYFTREPDQAFIPTTQVQKGLLTVSFHEMGALEAEKSETVLCQMNEGKVIWLVRDGAMVKKGDKIVEMDVSQLKTQLSQAKTQYESSVSKVGQAEEGLNMYKKTRENDLEKAKQDFELAKEEVKLFNDQLAKKRELAKDKLIPSDQIIQAEMDAKNKEMDLKKHQMDLDLLEQQVKSDIKLKGRDLDEAKMGVTSSKNNLDEMSKQISQAVINSPGNGLVVLSDEWDATGPRKLRIGDQLYRNRTIANIPDLSRMRIRVKLGESDASRAQIGMKALIRLDSVPGRLYHGTIATIDSLAKADDRWGMGGGQKKIDVMVSLAETDPSLLKPGMTADVEFINKQIQGTVFMPIEGIFEKQGKTVAYVKSGNSYQPVPVKTGVQNDIDICIREGLKKGQTVALRDPTRPLDEQEPRATEPKRKRVETAPIPGTKK